MYQTATEAILAINNNEDFAETKFDLFRDNYDVAKAAVFSRLYYFKHISESFKHNYNFCFEVIKKFGSYAIQYIPKSVLNEEMVCESILVESSCFLHLEDIYKKNPKIILSNFQCEYNISQNYDLKLYRQYIPTFILKPEQTHKPYKFFINETNKLDVMSKIVTFNEKIKKLGNNYLLNLNFSESMQLVSKNGLFLKFIPQFKSNRDVVLASVKNCGLALKYAHKNLQNNKKVVLEAVKNNGYSLKYASNKIKNNKFIVSEAIGNHGIAFKFASYQLKNNIEIIFKSIEKFPYSIKYIPDKLLKNKDFIYQSIDHIKITDYDFPLYQYKYFFKYNDFLKKIIDNYHLNFEYLPSKFLNQKEIALYATEKYRDCLSCFNSKLQNDKDVVLNALNKDIYSISYVGESIKDDIDILQLILDSNIHLYDDLSKNIKSKCNENNYIDYIQTYIYEQKNLHLLEKIITHTHNKIKTCKI